MHTGYVSIITHQFSLQVTIWGGGWMGGPPCRMSIIRNGNVALSNLRKPHVALSILRKPPVALSNLRKLHVACH